MKTHIVAYSIGFICLHSMSFARYSLFTTVSSFLGKPLKLWQRLVQFSVEIYRPSRFGCLGEFEALPTDGDGLTLLKEATKIMGHINRNKQLLSLQSVTIGRRLGSYTIISSPYTSSMHYPSIANMVQSVSILAADMKLPPQNSCSP